MVDIGSWQRPLHYGDRVKEALSVRNKVGIIDVSTLGKLDIQGVDSGMFLDKLYTHRYSNLKQAKEISKKIVISILRLIQRILILVNNHVTPLHKFPPKKLIN